jgi:hypothetical protein
MERVLHPPPAPNDLSGVMVPALGKRAAKVQSRRVMNAVQDGNSVLTEL